MESKLIVIAIGGNSLIEDSKHVTMEAQYEAARKTAEHIARLVKEGHRVVIAHGNGPQVGFVLRRCELAAGQVHGQPLDYCVADTQGSIGYQLQRALYNEFKKAGIERSVATVVSQVLVDNDDPAFQHPTKPVGSFMDEAEAMKRRDEDGWDVVEDAGRGWRRVVASPKPSAIVEFDTVKTLTDNGIIVIAAGGGGIPVVRTADGLLEGREAVVDKDFASAILAKDLNADLFVVSTAVSKVCLNFGKPEQKTLDTMTTAEAEQYVKEGHFAPGSMLPKIQAMLDFVKTTGHEGIITDPAHLYAALYEGEGTHMVK